MATKNNTIQEKISHLESIEKRVKKPTNRLWASIFFLLIIILATGFFVFAGINFKMIAQAFINDYDNKKDGDILTADEWNTLDEDFGSSVPTGVIVMWSGSIASIPDGWALCDGSAPEIPDLRDKFIVGAGASYNIDDVGGENTHTLIIAEMPQHRHGLKSRGTISNYNGAYFTNTKAYDTTTYTDYEGGGAAHENRPPYYALAYIMKL